MFNRSLDQERNKEANKHLGVICLVIYQYLTSLDFRTFRLADEFLILDKQLVIQVSVWASQKQAQNKSPEFHFPIFLFHLFVTMQDGIQQ